jgi:acyl carrier protein
MVESLTVDTWPKRFEEILRHHLPLSDGITIAADRALSDLGLDSLAIVGLVFDLEEAFAVVFPDALVSPDTFATAGSLWRAIAGLPAGPVVAPEEIGQ